MKILLNIYAMFKVALILTNLNRALLGESAQRRLLTKLFEDYNRIERPVAVDSESVQVLLGLTVQQIVNIDHYLRWDPEEYGNITKIMVPVENIWTPDDSFDSTSKVNAVVEHTGDISYIPPGIFKSTCNLNIRDFPFDRQVCSLKFGSWTYDESYINLTNKSDRGQNDSYIKNAGWLLEDILSYSESKSYDCCPDKYPYVMFDIYIRRRTLYYEFNLIFPCVFISCLTLLGFMLPPESGEKIGLEVTILLVIITFSLLVSDSIPVSSLSLTRIGIYFMCITIISSASILANIFTLIFHYRNVKIIKSLPRWIEILVCKYLAKLLRMEPPFKIGEPRKKGREAFENHQTNFKFNIDHLLMKENGRREEPYGCFDDDYLFETLNNNSTRNLFVANNINKISAFKLSKNHETGDTPSSASSLDDQHPIKSTNRDDSTDTQSVYDNSTIEIYFEFKKDIIKTNRYLNAMLQQLTKVTRKMEEDGKYETEELKCKFAALVIDRLCMVVFSILLFLSTAILFTEENFLKDSDPHVRF